MEKQDNIKNSYCGDELKKIKSLCLKLQKLSIPIDSGMFTEMGSEDEVKTYFINSLNFFSSETIKNYFTNRIKNLAIEKSSLTGEISLESSRPISNTILTMKDQIEFAHLVGYIPEIESPRDGYIEYMEVFPIFMEFLTYVRRNPNFDACFEYFIMNQLSRAKESIKGITFKAPKEEIAKRFRYIESLEYVIQLIEIAKVNKALVEKMILEFINGKSLIDIAKKLDIKISEYTLVEQEIKAMKHL